MPNHRDPSKPEHAANPVWRSPWFACAIAIVCYANSLFNDFTYDDEYIIRTNPNIRSLADVRAIWLTDWWYYAGAEDGLTPELRDPARDRLYRPLTVFTFALNYAAHGLHPFGFHAGNVLLHGLVTILVWKLAERLFRRPRVAGIAALLFAVHPIHAEAVANVVGRAELLAAFFLLMGLLALLPKNGSLTIDRAIVAGLAGLAALLAKETAICFPFLAAIVLWWRNRNFAPQRLGRRSAIGVAAVILLPLPAYFGLRYVALDGHLMRTTPPSWLFNPLVDAGGAGRIFLPFEILGHYLRLMLAPVYQSCDYGLAIVQPDVFITVETLLGVSAVSFTLFILLRYRSPAVLMLAMLFVASYALISNTVLLIGVALAERLFYWPSAIVCLTAALAVDVFLEKQSARRTFHPRIAAILGIACLAAFGLRAATRSADWASDAALFGIDAENWPSGAQLQQSLARIHLIRAGQTAPGRDREALFHRANQLLDRATRVAPSYAAAIRLRAFGLAQQGQSAAAIRLFEQAVALEPTDSFSQRWIDQLRGNGQASRRSAELMRDIATRPAEARLRIELIEACVAAGDNAAALQQARAAREAFPENLEILRAFGESLALNLQQDDAIAVLREVLRRRPDDWSAHMNLSALLSQVDAAGALAHADAAARLRPDDPRSDINLAAALAAIGRAEEAIVRYRGVSKRLPADDPQRSLIDARIRELLRK